MAKSKPKALIIGSKGMLGSELVRQAKKYTDWDIATSDLSDGGIDITSEVSVKKYFDEEKPDMVFNCAAFTDVEACEMDEGFELAKKVNGYGPGILAKYAIEIGASLIHISSDYVFGDNKEGGYEENYEKFKPLSKYGESKLLGEREILKQFDSLTVGQSDSPSAGSPRGGSSDVTRTDSAEPGQARLYIVRTSWLFGKGAKNFIAKIIELSEKHDTLKVVTDEVSCPTYVKDLAQRLIYIAEKKPESGIYHATGRGEASRYDFARVILNTLDKKNRLEPTTLDQFPRAATIPNYSVLLNTKLPVMRKWEEMVEDYLASSE